MQRTFTIIPSITATSRDSPDRGQQHVPPMTSKQVRKAYKASNRSAPISRAKQAQLEKAEQERIRKEFEKEKAAARAKAARERKREKELAEREEKKRRRLPLVNVRPSQDTIARFVRGNGSEKKRDAEGEALQKVTEETVAEEPGEGAKGGDDELLRNSVWLSCSQELDLLPEELLRNWMWLSGSQELDLLPEEDEDDMAELLDAVVNGTCGLVPLPGGKVSNEKPLRNCEPEI